MNEFSVLSLCRFQMFTPGEIDENKLGLAYVLR